jgi:hypothetical protein
MSASAGCQLIGRCRIVEADIWDRDYLDLVEPASLTIGNTGRGAFAFGVVNATMELKYSRSIVFFRWTEFDEGDEAPARDLPNCKTMAPSRSSSLSTQATTRPSRRAASELFNSLLVEFQLTEPVARLDAPGVGCLPIPLAGDLPVAPRADDPGLREE